MKALIFIVAIILGTFLIVTPVALNIIHEEQLTRIITSRDLMNVNVSLGETLSDRYRFGCWLTGTIMIVVGLVGGMLMLFQKSSSTTIKQYSEPHP